MNPFILIGTIIAILTYIPLCVKINRGLEQNFLTWILWAMLDGITFFSIIFWGGNFALPMAYTFGSSSVVVALLIKHQKKVWTWFEISVSILVFICVLVWIIAGAQMTTVAGTIAVTIAGFPLLVDTYKNPKSIPLPIYSSFFIANLLSTIGGKDWSIEERLYPASCTVYCFLVVVLILIKTKRR